MTSKNPLDDFFGGESVDSPAEALVEELEEKQKKIEEEYCEFKIDIPDDASLSDIVKLALDSYRVQIENIQYIEPKFRSRALEVAQSYLNLAKDTMKMERELQLKERKLDNDLKGKEDDDNTEQQGSGRVALYEVAKKLKNGTLDD